MRMSNRDFRNSIKAGWNELKPSAGDYPFEYLSTEKCPTEEFPFMKISAAALFCILLTSLFILPEVSVYDRDMKTLTFEKMTELITKMNGEKL